MEHWRVATVYGAAAERGRRESASHAVAPARAADDGREAIIIFFVGALRCHLGWGFRGVGSIDGWESGWNILYLIVDTA